MTQFRAHPFPRYVFALFSTTLATMLAVVMRAFFDHGILSFYLLSVVASAWVGGLWPGLLATVLGVLSCDYFFLAPTHTLVIHSADDVAELAVYSLVAIAISFLQTAQKKAKQDLQSLNEKLEDRVRERTAWLSVVYDMTGAANEKETVDQAFRFALRRITSDSPWRYSQIYIPSPSDPDVLVPTYVEAAPDHRDLLKLQEGGSEVPVQKGRGPVGRVRESGAVEWIPDTGREPDYAARGYAQAGLHSAVVFPVVVERKVVAVIECLSGRPTPEDKHLADLMGAVGIELGLIVERKQLREGYSEAVWEQQRRTAQELHDGLGQRLTGLWLMGTSLTNQLKDTEQAKLSGKLCDGIEQALEEIRGIAKGVFPVDLDSKGLMAALKELVHAMESASGVSCRFECPEPVLLGDNRIALHLYRITQEAITNALKHGRPHEITVSVRLLEEAIELRIEDDGTGIPGLAERKEGAGLRIMRYRAAAMDAVLKVESRAGRGTLVSCLSPRSHRD